MSGSTRSIPKVVIADDPDPGDPPEDKGFEAGRAEGIEWAKGAICSFLRRSAHNPFEETVLRLRAMDIEQGRVQI